MSQQALGMIETVGYTTAVSAADAALKAANVTVAGVERVIGVGGALGVTIHLVGDVAAVTSAVQAGREEAEKVGRVLSSHVIPRTHMEVDEKILPLFQLKRQLREKTQGGWTKKEKAKGNQEATPLEPDGEAPDQTS
jgi:ethanolamine utilization protein EutM